MKKKKVLLSIGGLGLIGVGVLVIPNLRNGLDSLKSLNWFQLGGALRTKREIKGDNHQLEFGNSSLNDSPHLRLDNGVLKSPDLQLYNSRDLFLDDSFLGEQFGSDYIGSIKTIFDEIIKENTTGSIESRTSSEYVSLVKKHLTSGGHNPKTLLKNFQEARSIVETWKKSSGQESNTKALTQHQRQSLKKFYELHEELNNRKKKFATELSEVSKDSIDSSSNPSSGQIPPVTSVVRFLKVLDWENKKPRMSSDDVKKYSWDKWDEKNPLKPFYGNAEELKKDLESVKGRELEVSRQLASSRSAQGHWGAWAERSSPGHFENQQKQLSEAKDNSSGTIQLRVGSKLLEWMGQLSK